MASLRYHAALVMIGTSIVLVTQALSDRPAATNQLPRIYVAGDTLTPIPGLDLANAPRTLILFLRSGCKYCTASAEFYQRLVALPGRAPIVAVSFEDSASLQSYLTALGVRPDKVLSTSRDSPQLGPTPMLLLVAAGGRIERVWRGQLKSEQQEAEVIRALLGS
jgi:hypothetical protein